MTGQRLFSEEKNDRQGLLPKKNLTRQELFLKKKDRMRTFPEEQTMGQRLYLKEILTGLDFFRNRNLMKQEPFLKKKKIGKGLFLKK